MSAFVISCSLALAIFVCRLSFSETRTIGAGDVIYSSTLDLTDWVGTTIKLTGVGNLEAGTYQIASEQRMSFKKHIAHWNKGLNREQGN